MLRSMKDLEGYAIGAINGTIGHVEDFYFDDEAWVIRYLVVDTGAWLLSRRVLISPVAIGQPTWAEADENIFRQKACSAKRAEDGRAKPFARRHHSRAGRA